MIIGSSIFSQEFLLAQKEVLGEIEIGVGKGIIQYQSSDEGFYSPNGPIVDREGRLLFYPSTTRDDLLVWSNKKWSHQALFKIMKDWSSSTYLFASQEGFVMLGDIAIIPLQNDKDYFFYPGQGLKSIPASSDVKSFTMPFGTFTVSTRPPFTYSTELLSDKSVKVRDLEETRAWLPTQPGGFTIGDDGLLYRNGMIWSAVKPKDGTRGWQYIGKLASGHSIWCGGGISAPTVFLITDSRGNTELEIKVPWMAQPGDKSTPEKNAYLYNYGLGPWGELYCLLPPGFKNVGGIKDGAGGFLPHFEPDPSDSAELVVVRNHLKYFGRLNDSNVRLRKGPTTSSDIIGTYSNKMGFRILQKSDKEETIMGQKNYWYKVRLLDGTEGWFFGTFVHILYDGPTGNPPPWPNVPDW